MYFVNLCDMKLALGKTERRKTKLVLSNIQLLILVVDFPPSGWLRDGRTGWYLEGRYEKKFLI